jgi:hypothetical protein
MPEVKRVGRRAALALNPHCQAGQPADYFIKKLVLRLALVKPSPASSELISCKRLSKGFGERRRRNASSQTRLAESSTLKLGATYVTD